MTHFPAQVKLPRYIASWRIWSYPLSLSRRLMSTSGVYWMEIRGIGRDGKPSEVLLMKDGYFKGRLPSPPFEGNPKSITVEWVGWFRR
jgi:hypothetical protein